MNATSSFKPAKIADNLPADHPWKQGRTSDERAETVASLRDEKAERQAEAIANRKAANEAAGIISTVMAPDKEDAHVERERAVYKGLMVIADQFGGDEEYCGQAVVEAVCNRMDYLAAAKNRQLHDALGELRGLLRRFEGGEVDDQRIIRKQEWIAKCEAQRDGAIDALKGAQAAYRNLTGSTWYPRQSDPEAKARQLKTAAASDAVVLLERHGVKL